MIGIVDFGKRLKDLRVGKKLTQEQLAMQIGMTKSVVSAYESSVRYPSYDVLIKLASIFSVTTDYLLGFTPQQVVDITDLPDKQKLLVLDLIDVLKE